MSHPELATALTDLLSLDLPPVALSKVDARPEGVVDTGRPVPSSCALWRVAEKGVFYAEAAELATNLPERTHLTREAARLNRAAR